MTLDNFPEGGIELQGGDIVDDIGSLAERRVRHRSCFAYPPRSGFQACLEAPSGWASHGQVLPPHDRGRAGTRGFPADIEQIGA